MSEDQRSFFKLSKLLTEDEQYNLNQLLVMSGKKTLSLRLKRLPPDTLE